MIDFRFRVKARRDVESIAAYYQQQAGADVAASFLAAFDTSIVRLSQKPLAGSPNLSHSLGITGLRSWSVRGFPYRIFYLEAPRGLEIIRVLHTARDIPASLQE